jgi:hypothetical protein
MLDPDNATPVVIAVSIVFIFVVWSVPLLHRMVLPAHLHDDSMARAAAIVTLLVVATVAATITMRN